MWFPLIALHFVITMNLGMNIYYHHKLSSTACMLIGSVFVTFGTCARHHHLSYPFMPVYLCIIFLIMSFPPHQAIFSSVLPGEYMSGHLSAQIEFPAWFGKNSRRNKFDRLTQELQMHMRLRFGMVSLFSLAYML